MCFFHFCCAGLKPANVLIKGLDIKLADFPFPLCLDLLFPLPRIESVAQIQACQHAD
jgi:hypothetical protein